MKKDTTGQSAAKNAMKAGAAAVSKAPRQSGPRLSTQALQSQAIGRKIAKPGKGTQPVNNPRPPEEPAAKKTVARKPAKKTK